MHQSIATIDAPEFINLQPLDINPLMSSCEIKVLYLGGNRNHSFITKEVATEMAKTLRGAPIVGYYIKDKEDFGDHGDRVIIDDEGIKFEKLTKPYGFVAPDARVWFQKFEDQDDFGNTVVREYLMTTGYLWTEQFEECKSAATTEGKPQSMELDEKTLNGHWSKDLKSNIEFFIIHDAIFSKLCILGEDVEPCFEGASVKAPAVSKNFSLVDDNFKNTLFTMMQQLQYALKGGQEDMEENVVVTPVEEVIETTPTVDDNAAPVVLEDTIENNENEPIENEISTDSVVEVAPEETPVENEETDVIISNPETEPAPEEPEVTPVIEEPAVDMAAQYTALEEQYNQLRNEYDALKVENEALMIFKLGVEAEKKDEMISRFYMLSDEDKKEVVENKANYSLNEIEEKLSVICFRKKVNFDLSDNDENQNNIENNTVAVTFNLSNDGESTPAWIAALKQTKSNRNI